MNKPAETGCPRGAEGARAALRDGHLRARPGGVRARRGGAALGRRTARSTSTSSPGSRSTTRVIATPTSSRRSPNRQPGSPAPRTSSTRSRACASPRASPSRAWAGASSSATRAPRRASAPSSSSASARTWPGSSRPEIVTLEGAFHGRTLGALAATPKLAREDLFGPLPQGFVAVPRDDPDALRAAVGESTAAVMIEPIQGEAGIFPIADEVLVAAREACDAVGAALVFDEVQCGMGRTGTLWAYEQLEVEPDVHDGGEGARRRSAGRRRGDDAGTLGGLHARRPRLHLRRRPDHRRCRAGRARR